MHPEDKPISELLADLEARNAERTRLEAEEQEDMTPHPAMRHISACLREAFEGWPK